MKKRNIFSVALLPFFAVICYFSANDVIKDNFLWILLSVYLFLSTYGILFIAHLFMLLETKENNLPESNRKSIDLESINVSWIDYVYLNANSSNAFC